MSWAMWHCAGWKAVLDVSKYRRSFTAYIEEDFWSTPEDERTTISRNVGKQSPNDTASYAEVLSLYRRHNLKSNNPLSCLTQTTVSWNARETFCQCQRSRDQRCCHGTRWPCWSHRAAAKHEVMPRRNPILLADIHPTPLPHRRGTRFMAKFSSH